MTSSIWEIGVALFVGIGGYKGLQWFVTTLMVWRKERREKLIHDSSVGLDAKRFESSEWESISRVRLDEIHRLETRNIELKRLLRDMRRGLRDLEYLASRLLIEELPPAVVRVLQQNLTRFQNKIDEVKSIGDDLAD